MKLRWTHFAIVFAGLSATSVGYLLKRKHLESGYVSSVNTKVSIKASVRGREGRPVKNARISIFDPTQVVLGATDELGNLETEIAVTSGKSIVIQADGVAFQMRRDILVPRALNYQASVFFDMAEVHEGNATLISTSNSSSIGLMPKPTPAPQESNILTDFSGLNRTPAFVLELEDKVNQVASTPTSFQKFSLACGTLDTTPEIHRCTKGVNGQIGYQFLMKKLPESVEEVETWVNQLKELKTEPLTDKITASEREFVIRHGGHSVDAYVDGFPLRVWKEKSKSTIYRADVRFDQKSKRKVDLTIVTESGQVFQKKIKWPPRRKVIITRIPKKSDTRLSKK